MAVSAANPTLDFLACRSYGILHNNNKTAIDLHVDTLK